MGDDRTWRCDCRDLQVKSIPLITHTVPELPLINHGLIQVRKGFWVGL